MSDLISEKTNFIAHRTEFVPYTAHHTYFYIIVTVSLSYVNTVISLGHIRGQTSEVSWKVQEPPIFGLWLLDAHEVI